MLLRFKALLILLAFWTELHSAVPVLRVCPDVVEVAAWAEEHMDLMSEELAEELLVLLG